MFKDKQYTGRSMHSHSFYWSKTFWKKPRVASFLFIIVKEIFKQYFDA